MHCANTGVGRWFGWPRVVSGGDFEDRDEAVAVDLYFGDVCFDDCFALAGCTGGQDVCQVVAESLDVLWAGWGWWAAGELVEFGAAVAELVEFDGEVADAVAAGAFVEGAVLECSEVAGGDGGVDEVGAAVEVDQCLLYGFFEVVGVDAGGGAAGGTNPFPAIPAVMVSAADGADPRASLPATATLAAASTATLINDPGFANVIAGFSSRGPTPHAARLKPDVTGPGVNILSTVFNSGLGFSSGTSMSSPHIAGAAAALLALHPDWSPADVKSAIVNTADPTAVTDHVTGTVDPGVLTRGAGLADLGAAAVTPVTLDPAMIGFGAWQGNRSVDAERQVTIHNVSGGAVTCDLAISGSGIVAVSATRVSLGAGDTATVTVTLAAGNQTVTPTGDYDGSLSVDCGTDGSVHAPWWTRIIRAN
jgi:hypothetical protein